MSSFKLSPLDETMSSSKFATQLRMEAWSRLRVQRSEQTGPNLESDSESELLAGKKISQV